MFFYVCWLIVYLFVGWVGVMFGLLMMVIILVVLVVVVIGIGFVVWFVDDLEVFEYGYVDLLVDYLYFVEVGYG